MAQDASLRHRLLAIAGLALAAAAPAAAATQPENGFNAESVDRFIEQNRDATPSAWSHLGAAERARLSRLAEAAEGFRRLAVTDLAGLRAALGSDGRARLEAVFGAADDAPRAHLWQFFLEDSVIYFGNGLAETPRVGFYNPLIDGWLVADWTQERAATAASRMALARLAAVTGDSMRGAGQFAKAGAYWVSLRGGTIVEALAASHRLGVAAFEKRFPPFGTQAMAAAPDEAPVLELRLRQAAQALVGLDRLPAYRDAVERLQAALVRGDAPAIRAQMVKDTASRVERIAGTSSLLRGMLRPNGAYARADGLTVTLGAPFSGRWVLIADYGVAQASGAPPLLALVLVDLVALERN